ncbi:MFS transporter [Flexivirga sp. B27]
MKQLWRFADFRWLALGQGLSWLGDGFVAVAFAVAVLTHGGSASDLGIPIGATMAGRLVFTLVGGVWADRVQPTTVMRVSDWLRAALTTGLALSFATGHWNVVSLALIFALLGAVAAFFGPAMMSLKVHLVPPDQRQSSNSTLGMLQNVASISGPVLAGILVATAGAPSAFIVNALSYVVSAICITKVQARPEQTERSSFLRDLHGGLRAVLDRRWLSAGILAALCYHIGNGVVLILVQVVAVRDLGGAHAVGWTEASIAIGSLAGFLLAMRLHPRRLLVAGYLLLVLTPLGMLPLVPPMPLPVVMAGLVVGFAALMTFSVFYETALQDHVPPHLFARVASWDILGSWAVLPLSSASAGVLATHFGTGRVITWCVGLMLLASVGPLLVPDTWRITRITHTPQEDASAASPV